MEHTHQKKRFSEEATLDTVEKKIDHTMEKIMNKSFVHMFLTTPVIKNILNSRFVHDSNNALQEYLKTIFIVVGRISLIT